MIDFKGRDLKNVIKIVCNREFFNELVDFPNIIMKDYTYYYKGIPISIDENLKYKTCELLYKNDNNFYDGIVTRLKCYGKNDLNICSMPSDKFHEKGKPYIECFDYLKENDYGFSEETKEQFIIEKTYVNENIADVHELYILGLECLLKKCRPKVSIGDNKINNRNDKNDNNFYDDIVVNLKQEAKHLNDRLTRFRSNNEMNGYIATLKSLRETLDLIKKYDWQLMYSEYGVFKSNKDSDRGKIDNIITEISVWEQNHDGQIKNHKIWRTDIPYKKCINSNI